MFSCIILNEIQSVHEVNVAVNQFHSNKTLLKKFLKDFGIFFLTSGLSYICFTSLIVSGSKEKKFRWDSLEDDRWILSYCPRHEIAGDTWYMIIKEHPSSNRPLAFISVTSWEHRWLYLCISELQSKMVCIVSSSLRKPLSSHLCGLRCDNFGVKPSSLFWELGAIGCRAVYPKVSCKGHLLGPAVVINTGTCPGQWLRDYKRRKLIPLHCSALKYRSSQSN